MIIVRSALALAKLKKSRDDQFDKNLLNHMDSLGISSIPAYKQWCSENGFSRRLKKSTSDRRKERAAIVECRSDTQMRSRQRARLSQRETVEKIFARELYRSDVGEKHHVSLIDSVHRLSQSKPNEFAKSLNALKKLYRACENRRVKFIGNSRPALKETPFRSCTYVEALAAIATFSDRWIRPLETWKFRTHNQRKQFESLVSHLFEVHSVPNFFYKVWFLPCLKLGLEDQSAFVHVAAGHSIRTTSTPIPMTKRMSHHFLRAPSECGFSQAIRWGQVLGNGGDALLARAVLGTFLHDNFENHSFWNSVIQWFTKHPMFDRDLFGAIADFLRNQKFGHGNMERIEVQIDGTQRHVTDPPARPNLSMKGRTPQSLLKEVDRWHGALRRIRRGKCHVKWPHSGLREFRLTEGEEKKSIWTIRQLLGTSELNEEGQAMNHCVATYANSCYQGRTSIWTMRHQKYKLPEKRALTLEVRLGNQTIVQIRGKSNRRATSEEMRIVNRWAQLADLNLSNFL